MEPCSIMIRSICLPWGEHKRFTAGTERVVVNFRGVRILLEVCYDLRFPVWARNLGDYDMILYVASWLPPVWMPGARCFVRGLLKISVM